MLKCSEEFKQAAQLIREAQSIAICGHTNPDGDALGAGLALFHALSSGFPDKDMALLLADEAPVPEMYRFLAGSENYKPASFYTKSPELFISVDTPNPQRLRLAQEVFERADKTLALDHHPDMSPFALCSIKSSDQAAASCLVYELIDEMGIPFTREAAQAILVGIITDTGRFQYQNTNGPALEIAARMVEAGADPAEVSLQVYQSASLAYLKLESLVTQRIECLYEGRLAYSWVREEDFQITGACRDESDGLIDVVRRLKGAEVCLLLREETSQGHVRGNLRSKSERDIACVARALGGGGHAAAAGFSVQGSLDEVKEQVFIYLRQLFN